MTTEIRGISSMATAGLLRDLAALHTHRSGVPVTFLSIGGVDAARRVADGEAFDLVVLAADAIDRLVSAGRLDASGRVDLAGSGVGVAVRQGTTAPAIDTEDALRQAVRGAGRIAYSSGPSGNALLALFKRWGLADELAPRLVQAPPGIPVGALLARGDAELGFQQMSELLGVSGITLVGPLPPAVQIVTVFSAAPTVDAAQPDATRALLAFMASTQADDVRLQHGLQAPPRR